MFDSDFFCLSDHLHHGLYVFLLYDHSSRDAMTGKAKYVYRIDSQYEIEFKATLEQAPQSQGLANLQRTQRRRAVQSHARTNELDEKLRERAIKIGLYTRMEDGDFLWFPDDTTSAYAAWILRSIADEIDRKNNMEEKPIKSPPNTVRVRIAVAVDSSKRWCGFGGSDLYDLDSIKEAKRNVEYDNAVSWVEADLPIPSPMTVQGDVT